MTQYNNIMPLKTKLKSKRKVVRRKRTSALGLVKETKFFMPFTRNCQLFPDRYYATGRASYSLPIYQVGVTVTNQSYQLAILGNQCHGANLAVNGAAYGTAVVPAGMYYLSGDPSKAAALQGGNAPYLKYRISASKITVRWMPVPKSSNQITQLVVLPNDSNNPNILDGYDLSFQQTVREQPYAKSQICPAYSLGKPSTINSSMSTLLMYGDKFKSTLENGDFDMSYNAQGGNAWQWLIYLYAQNVGADPGDFTIDGLINIDIKYDLEFFQRNTFISTAPA